MLENYNHLILLRRLNKIQRLESDLMSDLLSKISNYKFYLISNNMIYGLLSRQLDLVDSNLYSNDNIVFDFDKWENTY